jgi:hypothetical protein
MKTVTRPQTLPFLSLSFAFKRPLENPEVRQSKTNPFLNLGRERCAGFITPHRYRNSD